MSVTEVSVGSAVRVGAAIASPRRRRAVSGGPSPSLSALDMIDMAMLPAHSEFASCAMDGDAGEGLREGEGQEMLINAISRDCCWLCQCSRKQYEKEHRNSKFSDAGSPISRVGVLAEFLPWMCGGCEKSMEEDDRRPDLLPLISLAGFTSAMPGEASEEADDEGKKPEETCTCKECVELREVHVRRECEAQQLQRCWAELSTIVARLYRAEPTVALADTAPGNDTPSGLVLSEGGASCGGGGGSCREGGVNGRTCSTEPDTPELSGGVSSADGLEASERKVPVDKVTACVNGGLDSDKARGSSIEGGGSCVEGGGPCVEGAGPCVVGGGSSVEDGSLCVEGGATAAAGCAGDSCVREGACVSGGEVTGAGEGNTTAGGADWQMAGGGGASSDAALGTDGVNGEVTGVSGTTGRVTGVEGIDVERMNEHVARLCGEDAHQLFQRLEAQAREVVIEMKVRVLSELTLVSDATPAVQRAHVVVCALLREYEQLCSACKRLANILTHLVERHLKRFSLTWLLHNKHLFHSIIYMDPVVQNCLPRVVALLRSGLTVGSEDVAGDRGGPEDEAGGGRAGAYARALGEYARFQTDMTLVGTTWRECQAQIDKYSEKQAAHKMKQKMLREDLEFFKAQRRLLEQMVPKNKAARGEASCATAHTSCEVQFTEMNKILSGAGDKMQEYICPSCKQVRCSYDESSISHLITCGYIEPEVAEEAGGALSHSALDPSFDPFHQGVGGGEGGPGGYLMNIKPPSMPSSAGSSGGEGESSEEDEGGADSPMILDRDCFVLPRCDNLDVSGDENVGGGEDLISTDEGEEIYHDARSPPGPHLAFPFDSSLPPLLVEQPPPPPEPLVKGTGTEGGCAPSQAPQGSGGGSSATERGAVEREEELREVCPPSSSLVARMAMKAVQLGASACTCADCARLLAGTAACTAASSDTSSVTSGVTSGVTSATSCLYKLATAEASKSSRRLASPRGGAHSPPHRLSTHSPPRRLDPLLHTDLYFKRLLEETAAAAAAASEGGDSDVRFERVSEGGRKKSGGCMGAGGDRERYWYLRRLDEAADFGVDVSGGGAGDSVGGEDEDIVRLMGADPPMPGDQDLFLQMALSSRRFDVHLKRPADSGAERGGVASLVFHSTTQRGGAPGSPGGGAAIPATLPELFFARDDDSVSSSEDAYSVDLVGRFDLKAGSLDLHNVDLRGLAELDAGGLLGTGGLLGVPSVVASSVWSVDRLLTPHTSEPWSSSLCLGLSARCEAAAAKRSGGGASPDGYKPGASTKGKAKKEDAVILGEVGDGVDKNVWNGGEASVDQRSARVAPPRAACRLSEQTLTEVGGVSSPLGGAATTGGAAPATQGGAVNGGVDAPQGSTKKHSAGCQARGSEVKLPPRASGASLCAKAAGCGWDHAPKTCTAHTGTQAALGGTAPPLGGIQGQAGALEGRRQGAVGAPAPPLHCQGPHHADVMAASAAAAAATSKSTQTTGGGGEGARGKAPPRGGGGCALHPCEREEGEVGSSGGLGGESSSEKSSASSTPSQKEGGGGGGGVGGKHCECWHCEFFGHITPSTVPTNKNYAEVRDRLRMALKKKKEKENKQPGGGAGTQSGSGGGACTQHQPTDGGLSSLEEIIRFINGVEAEGGKDGARCASSSSAKKNKQKKKIKDSQTLVDQAPSNKKDSPQPTGPTCPSPRPIGASPRPTGALPRPDGTKVSAAKFQAEVGSAASPRPLCSSGPSQPARGLAATGSPPSGPPPPGPPPSGPPPAYQRQEAGGHGAPLRGGSGSLAESADHRGDTTLRAGVGLGGGKQGGGRACQGGVSAAVSVSLPAVSCPLPLPASAQTNGSTTKKSKSATALHDSCGPAACAQRHAQQHLAQQQHVQQQQQHAQQQHAQQQHAQLEREKQQLKDLLAAQGVKKRQLLSQQLLLSQLGGGMGGLQLGGGGLKDDKVPLPKPAPTERRRGKPAEEVKAESGVEPGAGVLASRSEGGVEGAGKDGSPGGAAGAKGKKQQQQPQLQQQRRRNKSSTRTVTVDEVFLPKEGRDGAGVGGGAGGDERDDFDHEIEEFKRFCFDTPPPQKREKLRVHLNLKDIFPASSRKSKPGCPI